jgi:hypothetical protein
VAKVALARGAFVFGAARGHASPRSDLRRCRRFQCQLAGPHYLIRDRDRHLTTEFVKTLTQRAPGFRLFCPSTVTVMPGRGALVLHGANPLPLTQWVSHALAKDDTPEERSRHGIDSLSVASLPHGIDSPCAGLLDFSSRSLLCPSVCVRARVLRRAHPGQACTAQPGEFYTPPRHINVR